RQPTLSAPHAARDDAGARRTIPAHRQTRQQLHPADFRPGGRVDPEGQCRRGISCGQSSTLCAFDDRHDRLLFQQRADDAENRRLQSPHPRAHRREKSRSARLYFRGLIRSQTQLPARSTPMSARNRFFILLGIIFLIAASYYYFSTDHSRDLVLIGTVDSNQVIVSAQVEGRIQKLLVDEGTPVKA